MSSTICRLRESRKFLLLNGNSYMIDLKNGISHSIDINRWIEIHNKHKIIKDNKNIIYSYRKNIKYQDYSNQQEALSKDLEYNSIQHDNNIQPPLTLIEDVNKYQKIELNKPIFGIKDEFDKLSSLCYWGFCSFNLCKFHNDIIMLKCAPSIGARHGIELYIKTQNLLLYYDPITHCLYLIDRFDSDLKTTNMILAFRPETYMWRYEHSGCLYDIYSDIGHILGIIRILSKYLDIEYDIVNMHEWLNFSQSSFKKSMPILEIIINSGLINDDLNKRFGS